MATSGDSGNGGQQGSISPYVLKSWLNSFPQVLMFHVPRLSAARRRRQSRSSQTPRTPSLLPWPWWECGDEPRGSVLGYRVTGWAGNHTAQNWGYFFSAKLFCTHSPQNKPCSKARYFNQQDGLLHFRNIHFRIEN